MKDQGKGNLVEEFKLGNTKIKIYDSAYIHNTPEDIENILRRIAKIAENAYSRKQSKCLWYGTDHEEILYKLWSYLCIWGR